MSKVFISLLTFNDNESTLECLESIRKLDRKDIELNVVVIDNASVEPFVSRESLKEFKLKIIRSNQNLGFSGGHNIGIKYSLQNGADYIVILNNDTQVDKDLITNMLKAFKSDVGIVVPKIYFAKGFEYHKERYSEKDKGKIIWYAGGEIDWKNILGKHTGVDEVDSNKYSKTSETEIATGCCMMIKKEVFENVGLLDDRYFLYYEDADFSIRSKIKGFKIQFEPAAKLWHKNAAATGGSGSELQDYYITRNRLIFGIKYGPFYSKLALLKESIRLLYEGRKWQKIGVRDYYLRILGKGSYKR
ncbi:MAG: hypothetical protein A3B38_02215 [Candidatus Levybacteria bacterium RIFCSPLOWO2_01_FULL_36_13]|nr:MAG: hypothetical protein A2684_03445 [Candidatus Levybacteria bacterium RIFCSPHIGHO2_01_FULL_36_15b]OGH35676.1 MAG: hypothetical protein A3B38_02215 [Candidatus Levybacteria bacterium RIFCSPLOWO2_01_FULL_36_13]